MTESRPGPVARAVSLPLLAVIRLYQLTVSPLLGSVCRYHPSCSRYGYEAIAVHGPVVGSFLAVRRLLRCHPWMPGGLDPVPPRGQVRAYRRAQRAERQRRNVSNVASPTIVRGV